MKTAALLLLLGAPTQLERVFVGAEEVMAPVAECGVRQGADPATVIERREAPVGGRWWLPRAIERDGAGALLDPGFVALRRADGSQLLPSDVRATPAALSIAVPEEASPGEVFALLDRGEPVSGLVLRVAVDDAVDDDAVPFELVRVEALESVPADCDAVCHDPTFQVPTVPVLAITWRGGPAVLDVWGVPGESLPFDEMPREVDSRLLEASETERTLEVVVGEAALPFSPVDVHVRARDPDTLEELGREARFLGTLPQVPMPEEDGLPPCPPRDPSSSSGCAATPAPLAALALPLLGLRLRRLRRRS